MWKRIDPLFIYILFGVMLYFGFGDSFRSEPPADTIYVDRASLYQHIQYKNRRFDQDWVEAHFDGLSVSEKEQLITDYLNEEAMVREARGLGLDLNDFVIRQRLIQKLQFIDVNPNTLPMPNETELADWFTQRQETYRQPERLSFTHIFFPRAEEANTQTLEVMRDELNENSTPPADALAMGSRFAYLRSYQDRTSEEIESHFGDGFAAQLIASANQNGTWQGPFTSRWGQHLVFVSAYRASVLPPLEAVKRQVLYDWQQENQQQAQDQFAKSLLTKYQVSIAEDVK